MHACRLTYSDKFRNVPTKLWKSIIGGGGGGGGGNCPSAPPPPVTLMAGNAKEADIWFGRESGARSAVANLKILMCLVVFLCWIKRFVLLSLCLKCKYRYFSSFQNSRGGGRSPRKIRGGTRPPPPPPPPPWSPPMLGLKDPRSNGPAVYRTLGLSDPSV